MNAVLESLREKRAEQISAMDSILAQVDDRDLVEAERGLLEASRQRIAELDAQIEPLAAYETLREAHRDAQRDLPAPAVERRRVDGIDRQPAYRSAGAFLVDYLRGSGIMERGVVDDAAAARVYQARAD